ncbi:cytochrome c3 family protein [Calycomorphotria hydatis]|uniref:Class III cytochrome C family protein n=1 Tax=Calycomorphotria hydatis TaxID=2528027 RepID=A0A517T8X6_9PLAN|nr:cytochrome c3 family protein [Calycomorphotria hydatis]QDT64830.1 Class III cytochrome C family protein [Calycomorphotria hydatis]
MDRFLFPAWVNSIILPGLAGVALMGAYVAGMAVYGASPEALVVGYQPEQPVPFSHALHAGKLKMDCRYCHATAEVSAHSAIPATATCGNCHGNQKDAAGLNLKVAIHTESPKLEPVRESLETGASVPWNRVHDLPDYAYFNHSAHVSRGVSCVECHGRVDKMEVVERVSPLNMGWCINCHREPYARIRPVEFVTQLDWEPPEGMTREEVGRKWAEERGLFPNTDCSTCHR